MNEIATSSVEEGLDFALNLIAGAAATAGARDPALAQSMLRQISDLIGFRYVGELRLALEYLECIHEAVPSDIEFRREQFQKQIEWLQSKMGSESAQQDAP